MESSPGQKIFYREESPEGLFCSQETEGIGLDCSEAAGKGTQGGKE